MGFGIVSMAVLFVPMAGLTAFTTGRAPRVNGDGIGRYGLPIHKRRALISSIDMFLKGASGEEKDQLSPGDLEA